jgi:thiopeptide-type bacteriocin biosynthesis protein
MLGGAVGDERVGATSRARNRREVRLARPDAAREHVAMSFRREFAPSGFFVLRTPLLPFDELVAWTEDAADGRMLERRLREAYERPELRDALYLASPQLCATLEASDSQHARKWLPALVSYFERAASRPTPFGLFAGCSVGEIGERSCLELEERRRYRRHTRLDMDYLTALARALEADASIRPRLSFRPNSSLYRAGGRLRYAESRLDATLRSYHLVAVDDSVALEATLARAGAGATPDELAATLVCNEISVDEANEFVDELIDAQVLVSDVQPALTGPEPVPDLVEAMAAHEETAEPARALRAAVDSLEQLDRQGLGAPPAEYRRIESLLAGQPAKPDSTRLFQLDLTKPARATLNRAVVDEIGRALELVAKLTPRLRDDPLERFRAAFTDRYEDREVPLMEALDEEIGIGFDVSRAAESAPLLAGLKLGSQNGAGQSWEGRDRFLLHLVGEALRDGRREVELGPSELDALAPAVQTRLPDALEVMATVAASSQDELDRGRFRVLFRGAIGAPGAGLISRFCHADDELRARVEQHLRLEEAQRPDARFAEIVHLPEGRVGNILLRPLLRSYEIPFLGTSGAPPEAQFPVNDLLLSVVSDGIAPGAERLVLRSRRLGCEVLPRLTSAHEYLLSSLGVYRFLCELQRQGTVAALGWDWGPLHALPFLPRVRSGRIVLARARWNLDRRDLELFSARSEAFREWCSEAGLPRWIILAHDDMELVTDLGNPLSVEALLHHLRRLEQATLVELFPSPDELCVHGPEGRFTHELVVPFVRTTPGRSSERPPAAPETARRRFPPGSEWLYAKLYTGSGTADRVLTDIVEPVVAAAVDTSAAKRWFFVRYADPHFHLRLRLGGDSRRLVEDVLPLLRETAEPLLADGVMWRLQLDTYERELRRYGGDEGIELSEELFRHDSDAVLGIVRTLWGDEGLDARWRLTLYGIDRLLDDFGLDGERRRAWARKSRDAFAREFHLQGATKQALSERYRAERKALEELLALEEGADHALAPGIELLRERSRQLAPIVERLRAREERLAVSLDDLLWSYAHMHANRLLRGAHRAQELVLYDLLDRVYTSRLAREAV